MESESDVLIGVSKKKTFKIYWMSLIIYIRGKKRKENLSNKKINKIKRIIEETEKSHQLTFS